MRVGAIISNGGDDFLKFLQQYGVTDVVGGFNTMHEYARKFPPDAGDRPGCHWDYLELVQLRERVEAFGMKLASLENPSTPGTYGVYYYWMVLLARRAPSTSSGTSSSSWWQHTGPQLRRERHHWNHRHQRLRAGGTVRG